MSSPPPDRSAAVIAHNIRRLMAKEGLSHSELVEATDLDDRTLRAVLRGEKRTRSSTLNKIAAGLQVSVDTLFEPPMRMSPEAFDMATNPVVEQASISRPELFENWAATDFAELASRFGVGGSLTEEGVIEAAERMNGRRRLLTKARVVLESRHADLLAELIDVLYDRSVSHE